MQLHAFLGGGSAERGEPLDPGEVRGNRLTGAIAVQRGGVHAQTAGQRRVATVCALLQTRQQQRELRHLVVDCIHAVVLTSIRWPVPSCSDRGRHPRHSPYLNVGTAGMVAGLRHPSPRDHSHPRPGASPSAPPSAGPAHRIGPLLPPLHRVARTSGRRTSPRRTRQRAITQPDRLRPPGPPPLRRGGCPFTRCSLPRRVRHRHHHRALGQGRWPGVGRGGGRRPSPPGVRTPTSGSFPSRTGIPGLPVSAGRGGWDRPSVAGWGQPLSQAHLASDAMAVAPAEAADRTAAPRPRLTRPPGYPVPLGARVQGAVAPRVPDRLRPAPEVRGPRSERERVVWPRQPARNLIPIRRGTRI